MLSETEKNFERAQDIVSKETAALNESLKNPKQDCEYRCRLGLKKTLDNFWNTLAQLKNGGEKNKRRVSFYEAVLFADQFYHSGAIFDCFNLLVKHLKLKLKNRRILTKFKLARTIAFAFNIEQLRPVASNFSTIKAKSKDPNQQFRFQSPLATHAIFYSQEDQILVLEVQRLKKFRIILKYYIPTQGQAQKSEHVPPENDQTQEQQQQEDEKDDVHTENDQILYQSSVPTNDQQQPSVFQGITSQVHQNQEQIPPIVLQESPVKPDPQIEFPQVKEETICTDSPQYPINFDNLAIPHCDSYEALENLTVWK